MDCLSTAKSPQQMFGAVAKSYFAQKLGVDPAQDLRRLHHALRRQEERMCNLPTMNDACGDPDVDVVLTTREIDAHDPQRAHPAPAYLDEAEFDSPLGTGTGAAVIFGATGGVMDAALRSAYYPASPATNPDAGRLHRRSAADKPWKEAIFNIPGTGESAWRVVSGLGNTRQADGGRWTAATCSMTSWRSWPVPAAAPAAAASPSTTAQELAASRGDQLWELDANAPIRFSHENPDVQALYREYLEKPLGESSHHLLHTDHHAWEMPGEV